MGQFRFENLTIWQNSIQILDTFFDISEQLNDKKFYRFSEQLRSAALSISNNIAEGSGSFSDRDFAKFLNYSRRSIFECVNMTIVLQRRQLINNNTKEEILSNLNHLSGQITNFRKTLLKTNTRSS
ncbi:MAG: four helix bundle protein [Salinivirgaceae bacterium]|nr:MAG: four helix bundle protein [Salinivirgaceae bacterium]